MNDDVKLLYKDLLDKGVEREWLGTEAGFKRNMKDPEKRRRFYEKTTSRGYDLGTYDDYEAKYGGGQTTQPQQPQPQPQPQESTQTQETQPQQPQQQVQEKPEQTRKGGSYPEVGTAILVYTGPETREATVAGYTDDGVIDIDFGGGLKQRLTPKQLANDSARTKDGKLLFPSPTEQKQQPASSNKVSPKDDKDNKGFWGRMIEDVANAFTKSKKEEKEAKKEEKTKEYNNASDDEKRRMNGDYTDEEEAALREYRRANPGAWATKDSTILRRWDEQREAERKEEREKAETEAFWKELEERPNEAGGYIPTKEEAAQLEQTAREARQTANLTKRNTEDIKERSERFQENPLRASKVQYNFQTGKAEQVHTTKLGNETTDLRQVQKDSDLADEIFGKTWSEQMGEQEKAIQEGAEKRRDEIEQFQKEHLTGFGAAAVNAGPNNAYATDPQMACYRYAQYHLDKAKRMQEVGEDYKRDSWTFLGGAARGLVDSAFDARTWDFGLQDLAESKMLKDAVEKDEKGEKLTEAESALLDAISLEMAINAEYSAYIGRGYKAGQVTGESLPFMLEMLANPASGIGEATAKKLAGSVMKRYGKQLLENIGKNATRRVLTASAIAGREIGNVAGAAIMTNTTGLAQTMADMNNRMIGDIQYEGGDARAMSRLVYNPDGSVDTEQIDGGKRSKIAYSHTENKKDFGRALWEAEASQAIERWSEFQGENIAPFLKASGGLTKKGLEKIGLNGVNDWIEKMSASDFSEGMSRFLQKTQWHGVGGEFSEEIIGGIANALLVGDQTLDTDPQTGVFNLDNMIDTFLGVGLQGGFMSAINTVGYSRERLQVGAQIAKAESATEALWGSDREKQFDSFLDALDGTADEAKKAVKGVIGDSSLTLAQKEAALNLAGMKMKERGMEKAHENLMRTRDDINTRVWREMQAASAIGARLVNPNLQTDEDGELKFRDGDDGQQEETPRGEADAASIRNAYAGCNYIRSEIQALDPSGELLRRLDENPQKAMQELRFSGANPAVLQICMDYIQAKAMMSGVVSEFANQTSADIIAERNSLRDRAQKDGMIHHATLKSGEQVTIKSEDRNSAIVIGENGEPRMIPTSDIAERGEEEDVQDRINAASEQIRNNASAELQEILTPTLPFNQGDEYNIVLPDGSRGNVTIVGPAMNEDGTPIENTVIVRNPDGTESLEKTEYIQQQSDEAYMQDIATNVTEERKRQLEALMPKTKEPAEAERPTNEAPAEGGGEGPEGGVPTTEHEVGERVVFPDEHGEPTEGEIVRYDEKKGVWIVKDDTGEEWEVAGDEMSPTGTREVEGGEEPAEQPQQRVYEQGGEVRLIDDNGNTITGTITQVRPDGTFIVETETPVGGVTVNNFSAQQLDDIQNNINDEEEETQEAAEESPDTEEQEEEQPQVSALSKIPVDEQDNPDFEKAQRPSDVIDAFVELCDGNEAAARDAILQTIEGVNAELKAIQKEKIKPSANPMENIANQKHHAEAVAEAQRRADFWKSVEDEYTQREIAAEQGTVEAETPAEESPVEEPVVEETPAEEEAVTEEPVEEEAEEAPASTEQPEASEAMKRVQALVGKQLERPEGGKVDVVRIDEDGDVELVVRGSKRDYTLHWKPEELLDAIDSGTLKPEQSEQGAMAEKDAQLAELQERLNYARERAEESYLSTPKFEKLERLRGNLKGSSMNVVSNINQQYPGLLPSDVSQEAWRSESCSYLLRDLLDGKYGKLPEGAKGNLERALNTLEGVEKDIDALVKEGERKRAKEIRKLQEAIADRRFELESGPQPVDYEEGMDVYVFDESGEPVRYMVEKVDGDKVTISRFEEDEQDDNAEPIVVTKAQLDEVYDSAREAWEKKNDLWEEEEGEGELSIEDGEGKNFDVYYTTPGGEKVLVRSYYDEGGVRQKVEEEISSPEGLKKAADWYKKKLETEEKAQKFLEDNAGRLFEIPGNNFPRHAEIAREDGKIFVNITGRNGITFRHDVDDDFMREHAADIAEGRWKPVGGGEPRPVGKGPFGNIYDQFKGKAREAIAFLSKRREGEAVGALHHKDVGDIDLVWGEEGTGESNGYGLAKIKKYHPEVLDDLQGMLDGMRVASSSDNRIVLESDTHKVVVSKKLGEEETPNWLLTAYEKKGGKRGGNSGGSSDIGPEPKQGKQNGTAPLQEPSSEGKVTEKNGTAKGKGEKNAEARSAEELRERVGKKVEGTKLSAEKAAKMNLKNFAQSAKGQNEALKCIYYTGGYAYISDGKKAIKVHMDYPKEYEGKAIDVWTGKEFGHNYPNVETVLKQMITDKRATRLKNEDVLRDIAIAKDLTKGKSRKGNPITGVAIALDAMPTKISGGYTHKRTYVDATIFDALEDVIKNADNLEMYTTDEGVMFVADGLEGVVMPLGDISGEYAWLWNAAIQDGKVYADGDAADIVRYRLESLRGELKATLDAKKKKKLQDEIDMWEKFSREAGTFDELRTMNADDTEKKRREAFVKDFLEANVGKKFKRKSRSNAVTIESVNDDGTVTLVVDRGKYGPEEINYRLADISNEIADEEWTPWDDLDEGIAKKQAAKEKAAQTREENKKKKTEETVRRMAEQREKAEKKGQSAGEKIEDWGERIEGARKFELENLAKTLGNVTEENLVALPISKVFPRQDFAKQMQQGKLSEDDAMFLEAIQSLAYRTRKPSAGGRRGQRALESWVDDVSGMLSVMKAYCDAETPEERQQIREAALSNADIIKEEDATKERVKELNPGREITVGSFHSETPIKVTMDLLQRLGYPEESVSKVTMPTIKARYDGTAYQVAIGDNHIGNFPTYEKALGEAVKLAKKMRGDDDVTYDKSDFRIVGEGEMRFRKTGKYSVEAMANGGVYNLKNDGIYRDQLLGSKEEAERYIRDFMAEAQEKGYRSPHTKMREEEESSYPSYGIMLRDPLRKAKDMKVEGLPKFETFEDARAWMEENMGELNERTNETVVKVSGENKGKTKKVPLSMYYEDRSRKTIKVCMKLSNGKYETLKGGFKSISEAQKWMEAKQSEIAEAYAKREAALRELKKESTFMGAVPRKGTDWRNGKDVTADEFGKKFGFRGVQFGNWTNQVDRQTAMNEAYDAFMDMAEVLGVSPEALSLNGELGIAFGSRGTGKANAHYEPGEVVINLTKTRGAGSLAHEWWHALDNYFSRQGGMALGMLTEPEKLRLNGNVRSEVVEAYRNLADAINGSDYDVRSQNRGTYWGSAVEETARLFAEWVDKKLQDEGKKNSFLSSGKADDVAERFAKENYELHKAIMGDEAMSFEDFKKSEEAYEGWPYPLDSEVRQFDAPMKALFDTIQEKREDGKAVLYRTEQKQQADNRAQQISDEAEKRAEANRQREINPRMRQKLNAVAGNLNLANVDILENGDGLTGRRRKAKGWYDPRTGRITIVLGNNKSMEDALQTLLHEAVAHHGLRQLFGERFDDFLKQVYQSTDAATLAQINEMARKNGWDFMTATEEYLAKLAEDTDFESAEYSGMWPKIKSFFTNLLRDMGFDVEMSENEMRYALWRSYQNLKEGKHDTILSEATDRAVEDRLNVGNNAIDPNSPEVLYRDGDNDVARIRNTYEKRMRSGWFQSAEAIQDSMQSLWEFNKLALGKAWKGIKNIPDYMNAYFGENRLSSVNEQEAREYSRRLFQPMYEEVRKLARSAPQRQTLNRYMMSKHGLERNLYMAEREARKAYGNMRAANEALPAWDDLADDTKQAYIEQFRRDYAGLTDLFGLDKDDWEEAEQRARQLVEDYEQAKDTAPLWEKAKAVSDAILKKQLDTGIISKATYDKVRGMYKNYIPLRGFEEDTADDVYAYLNQQASPFNNPIQTAKGRTSQADDPFVNLESMAESAILHGNRNQLVKQAFYNFVNSHPTDLVTRSQLWLRRNEDGVWEAVFCDTLLDSDTPELVTRKLAEFEESMQRAEQEHPEDYRHGREAADIPYRMPRQGALPEHQIVVKVNGKDIVLTVNGNPRLAQAVNGRTNPDAANAGAIGAMLNSIGTINRALSQVYTTWNPDFIMSNFVRDMIYSNTMAWVKENPSYAARFNANCARCNPLHVLSLIDRQRRGALKSDNQMDRYFDEFMKNGGETGYARMRDVDKIRGDIEKQLRVGAKSLPGVVSGQIAELAGELGRSVEMAARFAAYVTSREMGREVGRSIYDAKEISVNFNKKGAGDRFMNATGQTAAGRLSAGVSGFGRSFYVFWNAGVQGLTNVISASRENKGKATVAASALLMLGLTNALRAGGGGDGDDDEEGKGDSYWDIPEYVRRSNFVFRGKGNNWIKLPLPIEFRAIYGTAETLATFLKGKENQEEALWDIMGCLSQVMPIDMLEGQQPGSFSLTQSLMPSFIKPVWEIHENRSWTGRPIQKQDTDYNKYLPEWQKAFPSTGRFVVDVTKMLNEWTGGDDFTRGDINMSPAFIQYAMRQYAPFYTLGNELVNTASVIRGNKEFDWRYIPLVNRVVMSGGEQMRESSATQQYFKNKDKYDELLYRFGQYTKDPQKYADKINEIVNSQDFIDAQIFRRFGNSISNINKGINNPTVDEETKKSLRRIRSTLQTDATEATAAD